MLYIPRQAHQMRSSKLDSGRALILPNHKGRENSSIKRQPQALTPSWQRLSKHLLLQARGIPLACPNFILAHCHPYSGVYQVHPVLLTLQKVTSSAALKFCPDYCLSAQGKRRLFLRIIFATTSSYLSLELTLSLEQILNEPFKTGLGIKDSQGY